MPAGGIPWQKSADHLDLGAESTHDSKWSLEARAAAEQRVPIQAVGEGGDDLGWQVGRR